MAAGRIVVGIDGSPSSVDALRWALGQSRLSGAAVEAVSGWQHPAAYAGFSAIPEDDWLDNAREVLDAAVDQVGEDAAAVSRDVVAGHPARVLVDRAAGAELLVVGSRGHGGFTGMLLGSVSGHVVTHAPCPVVVVRHGGSPG